MNRKYFYLAILVIIIAGLLYIFTMDEEPDSDITVYRSELVVDSQGNRFIEAAIRNEGEQNYSDIEVVFILLDSANVSITNTTARAANLSPGDSTVVRADIPVRNAENFKLTAIRTSEKRLK